MKTVIAAIDFSDVSAKVLKQASELAKATGAKVTLVHGIEQLAAFYDIYGYTIPDAANFETHARERAEDSLAERAKTLQLPAEQIDYKVLEGPFLETLLDYAKEANADLLILGSHGHGVVARMLLGSTAQRVISHTSIPTLIVPA
ncbi:universal stress protein [Roseibacillus persicicus]|uniref:universal stress protein n=1 Tax=Roseibacillus persicicus TaxID=454148 RepID=UPI00280C7D39|nr:universal stress protein [Roseibacillus persicicus]MDQ8191990.1 universal stress protein [Roseibacillus persicicus]